MLAGTKSCCKPSRGPNTGNYSTTAAVCCIRSDLRVSVPSARRTALHFDLFSWLGQIVTSKQSLTQISSGFTTRYLNLQIPNPACYLRRSSHFQSPSPAPAPDREVLASAFLAWRVLRVSRLRVYFAGCTLSP